MATRWYRLGTVAATNGSKVITGTDTFWQSGSSLKPEAGDLFTVDFSDFYEVEGIVSDTQINLFDAYRGTNATGASYAIVRSASVNINTRVANMVTQALNQKQRMLDEFDQWLTEEVINPVTIHDSLGNALEFPPLPILIKELGQRGESSVTHDVSADYTVLTSDLDDYTFTILNLSGGNYTITIPDHAVDFSRVIECIVDTTLTGPVTIVAAGGASLQGDPITIPAGGDGYIRLIVKGTGSTSKSWFPNTGYYIGTGHQHSLAAGIYYEDTQSIGQDTVQGALDEHGRRLLAVESSDWAAYAQTESDMNRMIQENTDEMVSGFMHYGKHRDGSNWYAINEGMFGIDTLPVASNQVFFGRNGNSQLGTSKTTDPRTQIAGFVSDLIGFNDTGSGNSGRAKFPDAPDGTVIYDSTGDCRGSGNASLDLTKQVDPKYGNVAGSQNEAVARAFEGKFRNGNLRFGNDGSITAWDGSSVGFNGTTSFTATASASSNAMWVQPVDSSANWEAREYDVEVNVISYNQPSFTMRMAGTYDATEEIAYTTPGLYKWRVSGIAGATFVGMWGANTNAHIEIDYISIKPVTEEVVTERVDMFGGEFFLEAVTQANPYVYPKGMIQNRATTMNGITTVRSNRPATYYAVYDGDLPSSVFTSIDFSGSSGGWIGNHVNGDANGNFQATTGTGPRTPIGTLQVGKSYTFNINATVSAGNIAVWYWDGANNTNLGDISQGSFTFTCQEADGQVYLRSSFTTSVCNVSSVDLIDNSVVGGSVGLGVDFFSASLAQKRTMLSDSSNGLYLLDNGVLAQWRMRQRTVAGIGNGDWASVDPTASDFLQYNSDGRVNPQGSLDTPSYSNLPVFVGNHSWNTEAYELGVFTAHNSANDEWSGAVDGKCYFHVWGTAKRLNQGAYLPSFNEMGARTCNGTATQAVGHYWWHGSALTPRNTAECFHIVDAGTDTTTYGAAQQSGYIGTTLFGREDGRFYDAIYAGGQGGVEDDRLSAFDMSSPEEAAKIDAKVKNGTYRGAERLVRTQIEEFFDYHNNSNSSTFTKSGDAITDSNSGYGWYGYRLRFGITGTSVNSTSGFNSSRAAFPEGESVHSYVVYVGDNGNTFVARGVNHFAYNGTTHYFVPVSSDSGKERDAFNAAFPNGTVITAYVVHADYAGQADNPNMYSVSGEFECVDVLGNPSQILATPQLANGWLGYWIPFVPNGADTTTIPITRKFLGNGLNNSVTETRNNGTTWSHYTWAAYTGSSDPSVTTNEVVPSGAAVAANFVGLFHYTANAYITEVDQVRTVFNMDAGIGDVWASQYYHINASTGRDYGVRFAESLFNKVLTSSSGSSKLFETMKLNEYTIDPVNNRILVDNSNYYPKHAPIDMDAPNNDSPAIKALMYQTSDNQSMYLNYAYEELVYTAGAFNPWGDDRQMEIVAAGSSWDTDTNGNFVLLGQHRLTKRYGYSVNHARAGTQVAGVDLLAGKEAE